MRRKKNKGDDNVKLNLAAMLDMAFQLLTFFILTFRTPPQEGQVTLRLPKPDVIKTAPSGEKAGNDTSNTNAPLGLETLTISVLSTPNGNIETMAVGEGGVSTVPQLETRLKAVLADPTTPFQQIIIQVGSKLRYEELMKVIDVCTRQTLPDPADPSNRIKLTKLSFVELPDAQ
jgi:biopolymer transport protein ExbD